MNTIKWKSIAQSQLFTEGIKYIVVGGICTLLDFALLYLLTTNFEINYLIASIISFSLGTVLNYFLSTLWIFDIRVVEKRHHEFAYYLLITAVGLIINTALIWFFTSYLHTYFLISKLVATAVTFWWNFGARKYFLHTLKTTI